MDCIKPLCQLLDDPARQQAVEAAWRESERSSVLPGSFQKIREALLPLSVGWGEPPARAHHAASAALFELCLPNLSR